MELATAMTCLLPHPPNFTPVTAVGVFAGATFLQLRAALAIPLLAMLASDVALEVTFGWGFHRMLPVVYAGVACAVWIGRLLPAHAPLSTGLGLWGATTLFFLITNVAVWWTTDFYTPDLAGLVACYAAALPFYGNHLLGTAAYGTALFASLWGLERRFPHLLGEH